MSWKYYHLNLYWMNENRLGFNETIWILQVLMETMTAEHWVYPWVFALQNYIENCNFYNICRAIMMCASSTMNELNAMNFFNFFSSIFHWWRWTRWSRAIQIPIIGPTRLRPNFSAFILWTICRFMPFGSSSRPSRIFASFSWLVPLWPFVCAWLPLIPRVSLEIVWGWRYLHRLKPDAWCRWSSIWLPSGWWSSQVMGLFFDRTVFRRDLLSSAFNLD